MSRCNLKIGKIKALSFDLDDTLYDNRPIIENAQQQLDDFLHREYPKTTQLTKKHWKSIKNQLIQNEPQLAHDTTKARQHTLTSGLEQLGYSDTEIHKAVKDAMACFIFHRSNFQLPVDIQELLTKLAKKFQLVGISNGNVDSKRIGLDKYFKFVVQPGNDLRMKPYPDMFNIAANQLKLSHNEIFHIGDNWQADVQGARLAGLQVAWLNPAVNAAPQTKGEGLLPQVEITSINELLTLFKI